MASKRYCQWCDEELEEAPAIHNQAKCEKTERLKGREEIKKLKQSIVEWKNAWYQQREIIGWLWWYHPGIANGMERLYYLNNQRGE